MKVLRSDGVSLWVQEYAYHTMIDNQPTASIAEAAGGKDNLPNPVYDATCIIQETSPDESFDEKDFSSNIVLSGNPRSTTGLTDDNTVSVVVNDSTLNKQKIESSPKCLALRVDLAEFCRQKHCSITLRRKSIDSCEAIFFRFKEEVRDGCVRSNLGSERKAAVMFTSSSSKPKP